MTWVTTSKMRFYLHDDESLLDGLLRTGHEVNFQCREGYCGSCRVQKLSSSHEVDYPFAPLAMIEDNEILPCCCRVKGVIHIDHEFIKS
ncbi:class I ribonucleotide reductase maintenance protein YfaE [Psychrobacter sp. M13]|uniref:class I ribonucleotide reductase maintenance protein YfaE n=1 Tax=Psychrobacter sp. M13 TaxID=3067275 RepID=UPI001918DF0E|nr:class I ribonucleotide reductase maintenance protein YfaE [Psychrobacter sp. M13]WLP93451.1 class I ribonucleotide reductase maintenance protein YfaE [Psychrobacter sp. M13]